MHYGSLYAMADHKTKAHTIYASGSYQATEQVRLWGSVTFNQSKAAFDPVVMPDPAAEVTTGLPHHNLAYDLMHDYSNLDYQLINIAAGVKYHIRPDIALTLDGEYVDLTDNEGWVYGDESGSMIMVRSGVKFKF
jgi:hypothetical protein